MRFGENLMRLRKQKGYSQEDLAHMLGVSRQVISKWENNSTTPKLERIMKIAELFNVSLDELINDGKGINYAHENRITNGSFIHYRYFEYNYQSRIRVHGVPLVHIHLGRGLKKAKGIIAIGNIAMGLVAIGGISVGLFGIGLISVALLLSIGMIGIGLISIGAIAIGFISIGAVTLGMYCIGAIANGKVFALGAVANGKIVIGNVTNGVYELNGENFSFAQVRDFLLPFENEFKGIAKFIFRLLT